MGKRTISILVWTAVLIVATVCSATAASSYDYGTYGGSYYEVSATCGAQSYSSSTDCASTTYRVGADAALYRYMGYGQDEMYQSTIYSDRSHTPSVSISGTTYYELAYVVSYHYIDGVQIRSMIAHGKQ